MNRHRIVLGLLVALAIGVLFVDVYLIPGVVLPAAPYAVPILIAAYLLPPRSVATVSGSAIALEMLGFWAERPDLPLWISGLYLASVGFVGFLGTALSARMEREKEANEHRDDLLRALAHDLRTPLTVVLGQAQMLQDWLARGEVDGRAGRSARAIVAGVRRMNGMIQDLVDSTRVESGQLQLRKGPVDVGRLASGLLEHTAGVMQVGRVRLEIPANLPPVEADAGRLERVLTNLLSNALKYSPPESEVLVKAETADGTVRLSVVDRGTGIAPEELPRLFDRFYRAQGTRRTEGLGLGLYVARMLVEAHGGRIWAESKPGGGSTFSFTLPGKASPGNHLAE